MNEKINNIICLIIKINKLNKKRKWIKTDMYKCDHYNTYKEDYENIKREIKETKKELVDECNDYINYPKRRLFQKKVKIKNQNIMGCVLKIPFIDKREYYCLNKELDNLYMMTQGKGEYLLETLWWREEFEEAKKRLSDELKGKICEKTENR